MTSNKCRVGIITLPGYFNYGNRLQNYALHEKIKEMGFDADTLVFTKRPPSGVKVSKLERTKRIIGLPPGEIRERVCNKIQRKYKKWINHLNRESIEERTKIFKEFSSEYLSERFLSDDPEQLQKIADEYDFFVTGSDQVWNPNFIKNHEQIYFLSFVAPQKRVAYSASFGVDSLPIPFSEKIRPWLTEIEAVSVREGSGAELVKDLTGRDVPVLLDPTLLLSRDQWLRVAREARGKPKEKFLLSYFLGEKNKKANSLMEELSKRNRYKVIRLSDFSNKTAFRTGPREFIDYVNSAEAIFTDSFHGVVFAVLMRKPFVACKRLGGPSMYSRIETLLSMLDFKNREEDNIDHPEQILQINYSNVDKLLNGERNKVAIFLRECLKK